MKRQAVVVGVVLALTFIFSAVASAADRVGVIDLALVMEESKAGREANAVLNQFIVERQQALAPYEEELEELLARLEDEDESLADDEREALVAQFEQLVQEYAAMVEQFEFEVEAAAQTLREQLLADIGAVLQMVGDTRGFDLIMDSSNAYYYRRVIDLTFEVIREYDDLWEQAQRQAGQ